MVQVNTVFHANIESTVINGMYGKLQLVRYTYMYIRSGNTVLVHLHSSGTTTPRYSNDYRSISETPFEWRFAGGPIVTHYFLYAYLENGTIDERRVTYAALKSSL